MDLTQKVCRACEGGVKPFSKGELAPYLEAISSEWTLAQDEKHIRRTFTFESFLQTIACVNQIAVLAEREGHHPDMSILYNKLEVTLSTHAIDGLSENDFILAAKIDELLQRSR